MEIQLESGFEWDEIKEASNYAKHRVHFNFATRVFSDPNADQYDATRKEDGERRLKICGWVDGHLYTVVFTERGGACRLISARRANTKEERSYGNRSIQTGTGSSPNV
jgi:uncharacterized protein